MMKVMFLLCVSVHRGPQGQGPGRPPGQDPGGPSQGLGQGPGRPQVKVQGAPQSRSRGAPSGQSLGQGLGAPRSRSGPLVKVRGAQAKVWVKVCPPPQSQVKNVGQKNGQNFGQKNGLKIGQKMLKLLEVGGAGGTPLAVTQEDCLVFTMITIHLKPKLEKKCLWPRTNQQSLQQDQYLEMTFPWYQPCFYRQTCISTSHTIHVSFKAF